MDSIVDGVIVGGAGGAIAGITVYLIQHFHNKWKDKTEKKRIYNWLKKYTADKDGKRFRSTRAIASWNNLTMERVQYLCSIHEDIFLSTGEQEDMWGLYIFSTRNKDDLK